MRAPHLYEITGFPIQYTELRFVHLLKWVPPVIYEFENFTQRYGTSENHWGGIVANRHNKTLRRSRHNFQDCRSGSFRFELDIGSIDCLMCKQSGTNRVCPGPK